MDNNINRNISVWRGDDFPPTDYHLWQTPNGQLYTYVDDQWQPVTPELSDNLTIRDNWYLDLADSISVHDWICMYGETTSTIMCNGEYSMYGVPINNLENYWISITTEKLNGTQYSTGMYADGIFLSREFNNVTTTAEFTPSGLEFKYNDKSASFNYDFISIHRNNEDDNYFTRISQNNISFYTKNELGAVVSLKQKDDCSFNISIHDEDYRFCEEVAKFSKDGMIYIQPTKEGYIQKCLQDWLNEKADKTEIVKQIVLTQEEYDKLVTDGAIDENTYYNILEE